MCLSLFIKSLSLYGVQLMCQFICVVVTFMALTPNLKILK